MNTLVIGSNGQLGKVLQEELSNANMPFTAYSRSELDIENLQALEDCITKVNPKAVVNCAAYTAVDLAEDEENQAFAINAVAPEQLAKLCKKYDVKLIHISTDYVFDGKAKSPYSENDLVGPTNIYGQSKLKGEQAVLEESPEFIVLRTSWVFSEYGNNFVKTMLRLSQDRDSLGIVSDQYGRPTYARDLAKSITHLLNEPSISGLFHFTNSGETTNWAEFANTIFKLSQKLGLLEKSITVNQIKTEDYPTKATRPAYSVLNCDKFASTTSLAIPSWQAALEECLGKLKQI